MNAPSEPGDEVQIHTVVEQLSEIECPEAWGEVLSGIPPAQRNDVYTLAQPRWVEKMASKGKLLLHPEVLAELAASNWTPTDKHQRMIWASVLASLDGPTSRDDFARIKRKLIKKHGEKWWFDVYKRVKPAYAARQRIEKQPQSPGQAIQVLARHSIFIAGVVEEQRDVALRMIPKE